MTRVGGGLIFVWRVRRFSVWGLTFESLLKARLLRHDDVRFQRVTLLQENNGGLGEKKCDETHEDTRR